MPQPKLEPEDIIVTPEMIAAGREAIKSAGEAHTDQLVEIIYRAMAAEAPLPDDIL